MTDEEVRRIETRLYTARLNAVPAVVEVLVRRCKESGAPDPHGLFGLTLSYSSMIVTLINDLETVLEDWHKKTGELKAYEALEDFRSTFAPAPSEE